MTRLAALTVAAALGLSLSTSPAMATLYPAMTVSELAQEAEAVVEVDVLRKDAQWLAGDRRIATFYRARVRSSLTAPTSPRAPKLKAGDVFTFVLPGGEVGDFGQAIAGVPSLDVGDRVVVMTSAPVGPAGERRVVGLGLGVFVAEERPRDVTATAGEPVRFVRTTTPRTQGDEVTLPPLSLADLRRAMQAEGAR